MKVSRSTSPVFAAISALALLGTVALTGCSASELTGPDTDAPQVQQAELPAAASTSASGQVDDDGNPDGGGSTNDSPHNTMPEDD